MPVGCATSAFPHLPFPTFPFPVSILCHLIGCCSTAAAAGTAATTAAATSTTAGDIIGLVCLTGWVELRCAVPGGVGCFFSWLFILTFDTIR